MFGKLPMPTMQHSGRVPSKREAVLERGRASRALLDGAFRERALNVVEAIKDLSIRCSELPTGIPERPALHCFCKKMSNACQVFTGTAEP